MTRQLVSALADHTFGEGESRYTCRWQPSTVLAKINEAGTSLEVVVGEAAADLERVDSDWMQDRLRRLWKSSTPANSLDADTWLKETGRLLSDIPRDILSWAIDEAVKTSERGFMPAVGPIRAFADPKLAERKERLRRLIACRPKDDEPKLIGSDRNDEPATPEQWKDLIAGLTGGSNEPV